VLVLGLGLAGLTWITDYEKDLTTEERQDLEADARECYERWDKFYQEGKLTDALKEAQQLLSIAERLYPPTLYADGHPELARSLYLTGFVLKEMGRLEPALGYYQQASAMYHRLYPESKYPNGQPELAASVNGLGSVLWAMGRSEPALGYFEQALAIRRRLYPPAKYPDGHPHLAEGLNNLGTVLHRMGRHESALDYYQQALAMERRLYPESQYSDGHPHLATSLNNVGNVLQAMGRYESALDYYQQALAMERRLYPVSKHPDGHPHLAAGLSNMGYILWAMGRLEPALDYYQQALAMERRLYPESQYPDGHPLFATSLDNLGLVLRSIGRHESALDHHQQALAMWRRLYPASQYPDGHPDLAASLNTLGAVAGAMGRLELAQDYSQQALAIWRRLYPASQYPDGHPDLAEGLNSLGGVLGAMGWYEPALDYSEQALAIRQRLYPAARYPEGHPDLAQSLQGLGTVLSSMGRHEPALGYFEQALAMGRRLYPAAKYRDGHPQLALSLHCLGFVLEVMGRHASALGYYEQALAMYSRLARVLSSLASESEALAFERSLPRTLDGFLSTSQALPDSASRAWPLVWTSRAAIARLGEVRHDALATAELTGPARDHMEVLLGTRRQLARLLLQPLPIEPKARADRDRRVRELTEARERLERELARQVPALAEQHRDRIGPADLEQALPPHAAYVDLLRYVRFGFDPKRPGKAGETWTRHYVAFVVRPGQPVRRIELGPAQPIEEALADWRHAIEQGRDSPAAERLRQLVWEPIAQQFAPETQTVYLVPDGALVRLPWAALPGREPGTVLLEELQVAVAPHGPYLVQQLRKAKETQTADATMLMVGGVTYDDAPTKIDKPRDPLLALRGPSRDGAALFWRYLDGSAHELGLIRRFAVPQAVEVSGAEASTTRVLRELPRAHLAHLATHGFFNEKEFREEQRRAAEAIRTWEFSITDPRGLSGAGAGAQSPLSYTGLVLAGANHPEKAGPDGGILTGEMILGLDLRRMDLAVLSACQTGLGEVADGQCVQNLQRAFHVAGCKNVIASLWSVPDEPTAALMAVFYEELLHNHQPPLEALRSAQLWVYRHPDQIKQRAERGAPLLVNAKELHGSAAQTKHDASLLPGPTGEPPRRSAAKDWAGFLLSGPGR
jgi:tetratricopeptide (TPR) repeat protein